MRWDLRLIQRFMLVLGPVSSLFDFLTFYALLRLFDANEAFFQTGWFVESLCTQVLVIFVIRSRGSPWHSRPHPALTALTLGAVADRRPPSSHSARRVLRLRGAARAASISSW